MDVSLGSLRASLFSLRSWDSTGKTLDARIRSSLNMALDRLAGEVPEALVPDEQHSVLLADVSSTSADVVARVLPYKNDKRLLYFVDTAATVVSIAAPTSATTWRPDITGAWDGIMHIEITDASGRVRRRQSREWFKHTDDGIVSYVVSLDRPVPDLFASAQEFRIHQPEFFLADDVMEVLEPAQIFEDGQQQVWKIDTAGAYRQNMTNYQGTSSGRPYRSWRGRHFQLPAPSEAPSIVQINLDRPTLEPEVQPSGGIGSTIDPSVPVIDPSATPGGGTLPPLTNDLYRWHSTAALREGQWAIRYTYVWGRRDDEWQQSPSIAPGGSEEHDSTYGLTWAHEPSNSVVSGVARYTGISDPTWESAPSPTAIVTQKKLSGADGALVLSATNIDSMMGFGASGDARFGRTGLRIRYYVAHLGKQDKGIGEYNAVETNQKFYLLCEVEPTFDHVAKITSSGTTPPPGLESSSDMIKGARVVWNGSQLYDYQRKMKHSTGYYAWKVYPHQDKRYELDFRVLRLPEKYIDDQDTAPIQRDAVPVLMELALYYVSLDDGNDQVGAQAHLGRYHELVRVFRQRYANTGGIVEPTPLMGYRSRNRYGTFGVGSDVE